MPASDNDIKTVSRMSRAITAENLKEQLDKIHEDRTKTPPFWRSRPWARYSEFSQTIALHHNMDPNVQNAILEWEAAAFREMEDRIKEYKQEADYDKLVENVIHQLSDLSAPKGFDTLFTVWSQIQEKWSIISRLIHADMMIAGFSALALVNYMFMPWFRTYPDHVPRQMMDGTGNQVDMVSYVGSDSQNNAEMDQNRYNSLLAQLRSGPDVATNEEKGVFKICILAWLESMGYRMDTTGKILDDKGDPVSKADFDAKAATHPMDDILFKFRMYTDPTTVERVDLSVPEAPAADASSNSPKKP